MDPCRDFYWSRTGLPGTASEEHADTVLSERGIPVYPALLYRGLPGELLIRLKFKGEKYLASTIAGLIVRYSGNIPAPGDLLVPIPAGRRRRRERGYNQAGLIAGALASVTGAGTAGLLRRDDSPTQVGLSHSQRRKNVAGVFHTKRGRRVPDDVHLVLVDDVATTFSTLDSAAEELIRSGARSVTGLTLAYRKTDAGSIIPK